MKTRILVLLLLAGSSMFAATRVFVGIGVGGGYGAPYGYYAPPPPPPVMYAPPCPGPGYVWVPGSYYRVGPRWSWRVGYWRAPYYRPVYPLGLRYYRPHYDRYWRGGYRRY
jgi:hypothetical protein